MNGYTPEYVTTHGENFDASLDYVRDDIINNHKNLTINESIHDHPLNDFRASTADVDMLIKTKINFPLVKSYIYMPNSDRYQQFYISTQTTSIMLKTVNVIGHKKQQK